MSICEFEPQNKDFLLNASCLITVKRIEIECSEALVRGVFHEPLTQFQMIVLCLKRAVIYSLSADSCSV